MCLNIFNIFKLHLKQFMKNLEFHFYQVNIFYLQFLNKKTKNKQIIFKTKTCIQNANTNYKHLVKV